MRQLLTIATNAFTEQIRQPIFLILMSTSACFIIFLAGIAYHGFGKDPKMVKDGALAVMLLAGLFGAVTSASASLAREVQSGTALAVLAKPVNRTVFLLGKYLGLAGSLTVLTYVNLLAALLASRMAFDAYGNTDFVGTGVFLGAMALAYGLGGFTNYFLRRGFVPDVVLFQLILLTGAFLLLAFVIELRQRGVGDPQLVDWRVLPAGVLVLLALYLLAGAALVCSTRLDTIPTLAICSVLFLLGLMSDYLFGQRAEAGSWWAAVCYAVLPNWQLFWIADTLEGTQPVEGIWTYIIKSLGYLAGYLGALLTLALWLFEDRELSGT